MLLTSFMNRLGMVLSLLIGVVFAQQTQSSLSVVPDAQLGSYLLSYRADRPADFSLEIRDERGTKLYQKQVSDQVLYAQAFRLEQVEAGIYTFLIKQDGQTFQEQVSYPILPASDLSVNLLGDPEQQRYQVLVNGDPEKTVQIHIYDAKQFLLYEAETTIDQLSSRVYNFQQVPDREISIHISDASSTVTERIALR